jgi:hypothetical protein
MPASQKRIAHGLTAKLQKLLAKHSVSYERSNVSGEEGDVFRVLATLIPKRIAVFDRECIDSDGDYAAVLECFGRATCGDFVPTEIVVERSMARLVLSFTNQGGRQSFAFASSDSDYVAETFFDNFFSYCRKALPGGFVSVPTSDQSCAYAYLPWKAIAEFQKLFPSVDTPDNVLRYLGDGGSLESVRWDELAVEIVEGHTQAGETIVTAILKEHLNGNPQFSKARTIAMLECFDALGGPSPIVPNRSGETPYRLAKTNSLDFLIGYIPHVQSAEPVDLVELEKYLQEARVNEHIVKLIMTLGDALHGLRIVRSRLNFGELLLTHNDSYIDGEDTLMVTCLGGWIGFKAQFTAPGAKGGHARRNYEIGELDALVGDVRRFCTRQFWTHQTSE